MTTCGEGVGWGGGVSGMSGRYRLCGASAAADAGWLGGHEQAPASCPWPAAHLLHPRPTLTRPSPNQTHSSDGVHEVALGGIEKHQDLKGMDQAVFAAAPREAMAGLLQVGARLVRPWACRDFSRAHAAGWHSWRSWPMPRRPCPPPLPQYCKERYGGMRQYMEYCGFSRQQQDSLRRCLTDGDW